jgi:hypothetical protein
MITATVIAIDNFQLIIDAMGENIIDGELI